MCVVAVSPLIELPSSSSSPSSRDIRPVGNSSDQLTVKMGLKLSQIIGIDMKRQIMITNVWVEQARRTQGRGDGGLHN